MLVATQLVGIHTNPGLRSRRDERGRSEISRRGGFERRREKYRGRELNG